MKKYLLLLSMFFIANLALAQDVWLQNHFSPYSGPNLTNAETVTVLINNNSGVVMVANTIQVNYTINGGATVSQLLSSNLTAGSSWNFSFNTKANLSNCGSYNIRVWVVRAGDTNSTNNELNWTVTKHCPPIITNVSPLNAPVGTTITLTGTNFNTTAANNVVFFGATAAVATTATATSITVVLPVGATYSRVNVLNTANSLMGSSSQYFNPTFTPNKGSIAAQDFVAKQDFATGTAPYSVAIGDLDGDGKADLVVANWNSSTVSVFRNTSSNGSPSFAAKQDFITGLNPHSVVIGDLDGDGKADLAVGNNTSNTVSIFLNTSTNGSITATSFAAKQDFTTGSRPLDVAIGDLDGDGKFDLATANYYSNTVSVLRNTDTDAEL